MHLNQHTVQQLQLQHLALLSHTFSVTPDHFEQPSAYELWRQSTLSEVENLMGCQIRLPEYNGLLQVTVMQGQELTMAEGWR